MSTEEVAKLSTNKLSPFGNPINKNLLTPCRQVGLSRKRKTPNSIPNVFLASPKVTSISKNSNTTPLNHKNPKEKLKTKTLSFNSPSTSLLESSVVTHKKTERSLNFDSPVLKEETIVTQEAKKDHNDKKSVKKTLAPTFSGDLFGETIKEDEGLASDLKGDELCNEDKKETSIKLILSNVTEDSDDDFKIVNKSKPKSKRKSNQDQVRNSKAKSLKSKNSDSKLESGLRKCQITISKLSEEEISNNAKSIVQNRISRQADISDDDDFIVAKRKRVVLLESDDSDFQNTPSDTSENVHVVKIETQAIVHNSDNAESSAAKGTVNISLTKISENKENSATGMNCSTLKKSFNIDDEDDDFTSTPERESNEKIELIKEINKFETQIKQKRKKLDDLQQAAIYKSKHNVEELQSLIETWRRGCIMGLQGLLARLQQHGPLDMKTLLHNLHIPLDIAKSKIKLKLDT